MEKERSGRKDREILISQSQIMSWNMNYPRAGYEFHKRSDMRAQVTFFSILGTIMIGWLPIGAQEQIAKSRIEATKRPKMDNELGWGWLVEPLSFSPGKGGFRNSGEGRYIMVDTVVDADGGALRLSLVQIGSGPPIGELTDIRPVVFDADGRRYVPMRDPLGHEKFDQKGNFHVRYSVFTIDPNRLIPSRAAYIAVERRLPKVAE
jgi:hypothetical protein